MTIKFTFKNLTVIVDLDIVYVHDEFTYYQFSKPLKIDNNEFVAVRESVGAYLILKSFPDYVSNELGLTDVTFTR